MIKLMGMENTCTWMEQHIKDFGLKTNNMAKVLRHGQMVLDTKETMLMAKSMDMDFSNGQMDLFIMENLEITILKVMVNINGQMVVNT